jgi:predicted  nucleic acid-binding Zn-ribbon protein
MKACVNCGHAVSRGDRHSVLSCPPKARGRDSVRQKRKRAAKKRRRRDAALIPQRGQAVAGTGVPKGASGGKG